MLLFLALQACNLSPAPDAGLTVEQLAAYVRSDVADPSGWAGDVHAALLAARQPTDADHACQVLAIIEQESGYHADPAVPGLGGIVMEALQEEADEKLGFLGPKALSLVLDVKADGATQTFRERVEGVRTERDLDLVFRDLVAHHAKSAPRIAKAVELLAPGLIERLNPISTAGSMQVNVGFAQSHPRSRGMDREAVRDLLYTRPGGVLYGTLRLYHHQAAYDDPIYRFADYNAGFYSSRNAAFQEALAQLTGTTLTLDGDLVAWKKNGKPSDHDGQTLQALLAWRARHAPDLPEARLRKDARLEKEREFEDTETWQRVRATWEASHATEAPYARVPDVALDSPKLKGQWTTRTFAERVQRRHRDCLKRGG